MSSIGRDPVFISGGLSWGHNPIWRVGWWSTCVCMFGIMHNLAQPPFTLKLQWLKWRPKQIKYDQTKLLNGETVSIWNNLLLLALGEFLCSSFYQQENCKKTWSDLNSAKYILEKGVLMKWKIFFNCQNFSPTPQFVPTPLKTAIHSTNSQHLYSFSRLSQTQPPVLFNSFFL